MLPHGTNAVGVALMPDYKKWIEDGCRRLGISHAELGRRIGVDRQTINNLKRRNRMEAERFKLLAAILGPLPDDPGVSAVPLIAGGIPVVGRVGELWVDEARNTWRPLIKPSALHDPRFPAPMQVAYEMEGDCQELGLRPRDFLICVPWASNRTTPQPGDICVCRRANGSLTQYGLARAEGDALGIALRPMIDGAHPDSLGEPVALVIGSQRRFL